MIMVLQEDQRNEPSGKNLELLALNVENENFFLGYKYDEHEKASHSKLRRPFPLNWVVFHSYIKP